MAVVVAGSGVSSQRSKEPSENELASIATRLWWVLDAFELTFSLNHYRPDRQSGLAFRLGCGGDSSSRVFPIPQISSILFFPIRDCTRVRRGEYVQMGGKHECNKGLSDFST